jgi:hypothetical protein
VERGGSAQLLSLNPHPARGTVQRKSIQESKFFKGLWHLAHTNSQAVAQKFVRLANGLAHKKLSHMLVAAKSPKKGLKAACSQAFLLRRDGLGLPGLTAKHKS